MDYRGGSILAIDQNTRTGVAEGVPGSAPTLSVINFRHDETDDHADIYERATYWLADRLRSDPPGLIAIERVVPPSAARGNTSHNSTMITLGVFAIFVGIVRCKNIPLKIVSPSTWRASFLGPGGGRLKSADAKRMVRKQCARLGWQTQDDNDADAAGIWMWACSQVAPVQVGTTKPHLFGDRIGRPIGAEPI